MGKEEVLILAIESSCDETAAAVVKNGRTVLSNVISVQIDLAANFMEELCLRSHPESTLKKSIR